MAKQLDSTNFRLVIFGNPSPDRLRVEYRVVSGDLAALPRGVDAANPDWSDRVQDLWTSAISEIKTNEGIV